MAEIHLRVVDLYKGDRVSSFKKAAASGIWGVIHKATTGAIRSDNKYARRRQAALDAGLLWGAYHWGTHADVDDQVDNFLKHAKPDEHTLVALDYDDTPGNQMTLAQAREFLERIEAKLGRKAVLYSGHLIKQQLGNEIDAYLGAHRLWLAHYNTRNPQVQRSWSTYWLWKYTDSRTGLEPNQVPGLPGDSRRNLDCNSYGGTRAELKAQWAS